MCASRRCRLAPRVGASQTCAHEGCGRPSGEGSQCRWRCRQASHHSLRQARPIPKQSANNDNQSRLGKTSADGHTGTPTRRHSGTNARDKLDTNSAQDAPPASMPGSSLWCSSRICSMNTCTPYSLPLMMSCAYTAAWVAARPMLEFHHFMDCNVGVLSTNSCVAGSYSAVVRRPRTLEPWPSLYRQCGEVSVGCRRRPAKARSKHTHSV